jgi:hypothetical protein
VSPARYELGLYIPQNDILYSDRRETSNLTKALTGCVRFEVFTAVTVKNGVFRAVTLCGSCKDRRFGGTWYFFAAYVGG